jgi:DNA-binding response OmpR family regulator
MGTGEIWICAANLEASWHIKQVFDEANFLNPIRVIDASMPFEAQLNDGAVPLLFLVDLACADGKAWECIKKIRESKNGARTPLIALVDGSTEPLLDEAYDAGVQTYVRKPLTFAEFLQRARMLNMEFSLERPPQSN